MKGWERKTIIPSYGNRTLVGFVLIEAYDRKVHHVSLFDPLVAALNSGIGIPILKG